MRKEIYLCLCIHVGPLVDKDLSHVHSVFLSRQVEWGEAALQEIPRAWPSVIARASTLCVSPADHRLHKNIPGVPWSGVDVHHRLGIAPDDDI